MWQFLLTLQLMLVSRKCFATGTAYDNFNGDTRNSGSCISPSYIKFGQKAILNCTFLHNYTVVSWFMGSSQEPIIYRRNGHNSGPGHDSRAFRIAANGSLIINTASIDLHRARVTVEYSDSTLNVEEDIDIIVHDTRNSGSCISPSYIKSGRKAILNCTFLHNYTVVSWFMGSSQEPIIYRRNGHNSGPGHDSRAFRIAANGSLIINTASFDLHRARVTVEYSDSTLNVEEDIDIIVYVIPNPRYPKTDVCKENNHCLSISDGNQYIECYAHGSNPPANLSWYWGEDDFKGEIKVTNFSVVRKGNRYSSLSQVIVTLPEGAMMGSVFCESSSSVPYIPTKRTMVLVTRDSDELFYGNTSTFYAKYRGEVTLPCSGKPSNSTVWMRRMVTGESRLLGYFSYGMSSYDTPETIINHDGSLTLKNVIEFNEGLYQCIHGNSKADNLQSIELSTFIKPLHRYPNVIGCETEANCIRPVGKYGYLVCEMSGIRPIINLEWVYDGKGPLPIQLYNHLAYERDGPTFRLLQRCEFKIGYGVESGDINVSCRATGFVGHFLNKSTSLTLQYEKQVSVEDEAVVMEILLAILASGVVAAITYKLLVFAGGCLWKKLDNACEKRRREKEPTKTRIIEARCEPLRNSDVDFRRRRKKEESSNAVERISEV